MRRLFISAMAFWCTTLSAQKPNVYQAPIHHQVAPLNTYHRVIAVVPYVGTGKPGDPRRPKYAPVPPGATPGTAVASAAATATATAAHSGFIAFAHVPSDDGNMAIVEFVSTDRATLMPILSDKTVISFEKGERAAAEILLAILPFKKGFSLDNFGVAAK